MQFLYTALVLAMVISVAQCHPDEVTDLPGLPSKPAFRHYSGYLNATNDRYLHYWFVESLRDPAKDPLVLWMNGGPGCSSVKGLLTEHGPFRVQPDGKSVAINQYSWNSVSNMLFLEAPAGVGFSYSQDRNYSTDDDQVSLDNYVALQSFFKKFPQFTKNDFYISGESYAGIYVPTLSVRVLDGSFPINFKGFAVGNGVSDSRLGVTSQIFFLYYHGFIGNTIWNQFTKYCCNGSASQDACNIHRNNTDPKCEDTLGKVLYSTVFSNINLYNVYDTCAISPDMFTQQLHEAKQLFNFYNFNSSSFSKFQKRLSLKKTSTVNPVQRCLNSTDATTYLNQKAVRAALHIPSEVQYWTGCSNSVSDQYRKLYTTMKDQYDYLLTKVRGLVYNGDVDLICNFLGDQWFVDGLGRKVLSEYTYWKLGSQIAGFVKRFDNLDLVTIKSMEGEHNDLDAKCHEFNSASNIRMKPKSTKGAGHMVPADKPEESLKMIESFLFKKQY